MRYSGNELIGDSVYGLGLVILEHHVQRVPIVNGHIITNDTAASHACMLAKQLIIASFEVIKKTTEYIFIRGCFILD